MVTNGSVTCWADMGYGNFGPKISLGNAPIFEGEFDNSRLFFADIDGSGTSDLVYVSPDHVSLYLNQSGNSFSDAIEVPLPEVYSSIDQVSFADVLGNGTTCLVFTKMGANPRHYYYDFVGEMEIDGVVESGMKPYILNVIDNNIGTVTEVIYCSSTKFYLEDKKNGIPWITKLPYPVQVIEKIIVKDNISETRFTNRYKYHDGYYDHAEKKFKGFGYIETWDSEDFAEFQDKLKYPDKVTFANENYVPPVYTRTWYHTGVPFEIEDLYSYFKKQFFNGDKDAYDFPESFFSSEIYTQDAETIRQAYASLSGQVIRTEVYGDDKEQHPILYTNPFTVSQSNLAVELYQKKGANPYAVFMVNPRESITYNYERNPKDPRIQQQFTIATDSFGNVLQDCVIYLPRRSSLEVHVYPEQKQLKGVFNWNSFVNPPLDNLFFNH